MAIQVFIDWDGDNDYGGAYDNVTRDLVTVKWFLGSRKRQYICDEPTCNITLTNKDGKYSPENTTSPLYGKFRPSLRMRVMDDEGDGTELWNGFLQNPQLDWSPMATLTARHEITLVGVGAKRYLERVDVNLPLFTNATADEIIIAVLAEAGIYLRATNSWIWDHPIYGIWDSTTYWDFILSNIGTFEEGLTVIPTYGDAMENAMKTIAEIAATEQGKFYIARDGRYVFENRHHPYLNSDPDVVINSATKLNGADYVYGEDIVNVVNVSTSPRTVGSSETLWSLDEPLTIPVGGVKTFEAILRRPNGQFAGASSVNATPTYSAGSATITLIPRGGRCTVDIANTGDEVCVISSLTLAGAPQYKQNSINVRAINDSSVSANGRSEASLNAGVVSEYDNALAVGQMELARRDAVRGEFRSISMRGIWGTAENREYYKDLQIGAVVNLVFDELHHDKKYYIVGENHKWATGNVHDCEFFLEALLTPDAFRFDVSHFDVDRMVY